MISGVVTQASKYAPRPAYGPLSVFRGGRSTSISTKRPKSFIFSVLTSFFQRFQFFLSIQKFVRAQQEQMWGVASFPFFGGQISPMIFPDMKQEVKNLFQGFQHFGLLQYLPKYCCPSTDQRKRWSKKINRNFTKKHILINTRLEKMIWGRFAFKKSRKTSKTPQF